MTFPINRWSLQPHITQSVEQQEIWWSECFVPSVAVQELLETRGSAIVYGGPGSGKSIALQALKRNSPKTLWVEYPPEKWPAGTHPWRPGESHFAQMIAAVADKIFQHLSENPASLAECSSFSSDFLYWLIGRRLSDPQHSGYQRRLMHLVLAAERKGLTNVKLPKSIPDLYSNDENTINIRSQIEDLTELVNELGYANIVIAIDLNDIEGFRVKDGIKGLFRADILENKQFSIYASLPRSLVREAQLDIQYTGQLRLIPLYYQPDEIKEIIRRHLIIATNNRVSSLAELVKEEHLERLQQEIHTIYGDDTLVGWLNLGYIILLSLHKNYPEKSEDVKRIICEFYSHYMKLQLESSHQAVWRGHQLLKLEKQQFDILEILVELQGEIYSSGQKLIDMAGTPSNLNTLVSRIRKVIEPIGGRKYSVYIQNSRDRGYWLENFVVSTG